MNTERMAELAKTIREQPHVPRDDLPPLLFGGIADNMTQRPEGFSMAAWNCGTAGCIAGWTIALYGEDVNWTSGIVDWGAVLLEIPRTIAHGLFLPSDDIRSARRIGLPKITPDQAATVIEKIVVRADDFDEGETIENANRVEEIWAEVLA